MPDLTVQLSEAEPVSGSFTVAATPFNFSPASVVFRLESLNAPNITDNTGPFTVTLDAATMSAGRHRVWAVGQDDTYQVSKKLDFYVEGPNVVVVMADDLDETVMTYWDALPQTQALVLDSGLRFTNAFAPNPLCCPARASILTGKYSHNTGVWDNTAPDGGFGGFAGQAENDTIATRLQSAGYKTGYVGKYLNGYEAEPAYIPPGWDSWFGLTASPYDGYTFEANHDGGIESYGDTPDDYQTDVLADRAIDFVNAREAEDKVPFFLFISPTAPHGSIPPAPRHTDHPWTTAALPQPPNFGEPDVSDKATWLRDGIPPFDESATVYATGEYRRRMGALLAVDDLIASLVSTLTTTGELDNTYIVFVSDNGFMLGGHRLHGKIAPYEESVRVPLVIAGPGVRTGTDDRLVLHIDLAPTILDLARLPIPDTIDGRSMVPLFDDGTDPWRTDFLAEYRSLNNLPLETLAQVQQRIANGKTVGIPTYRAVRTEQYMFIRWYISPPHEYELYDLQADPYQLDNLVATPEGAAAWSALTTQLEQRLDALATCTGTSCRSP